MVTSSIPSQALLAAIAKASRWFDEIVAGGTSAEIAMREGKSERLIRMLMHLAFVPPATVQELTVGTAASVPIAEMARNVRFVWR